MHRIPSLALCITLVQALSAVRHFKRFFISERHVTNQFDFPHSKP